MCGDHGTQISLLEDFEYNPQLEAWVRTRSKTALCAFGFGAIPAPKRFSTPLPSPVGATTTPVASTVVVHVGSGDGFVGESVTVPITMSRMGSRAGGVEIELPLDGRVFDGGSCSASAEKGVSTEFDDSSTALHAIVNFEEVDDTAPEEVQLFTCTLHLQPTAKPDVYPLVLSGLLVNRDGWERLRATATDGEVVVRVSASTPRAAPTTPQAH